MLEYRCKKCQNLLMREDVREGDVEIKCPRCNTFNIISRKMVTTRQVIKVLDTWNKPCDTTNIDKREQTARFSFEERQFKMR
jgi:LSD1 subclass zinc finger protein